MCGIGKVKLLVVGVNGPCEVGGVDASIAPTCDKEGVADQFRPVRIELLDEGQGIVSLRGVIMYDVIAPVAIGIADAYRVVEENHARVVAPGVIEH